MKWVVSMTRGIAFFMLAISFLGAPAVFSATGDIQAMPSYAYPSDGFAHFPSWDWGGPSGGFGSGNHGLLYSVETDPQKILNSSFRIASREGRLKNMAELLNKGAELNSVSDEGWTALMYASRNCSEKAVRFLLERKADVNLADRYGRTALIYAAMNGCLPVVRVLGAVPGLAFEARDKLGNRAIDYTSLEFEIADSIRAKSREAKLHLQK